MLRGCDCERARFVPVDVAPLVIALVGVMLVTGVLEIKPEAGVASLGISPLGVDSLLARWASRRSVSER